MKSLPARLLAAAALVFVVLPCASCASTLDALGDKPITKKFSPTDRCYTVEIECFDFGKSVGCCGEGTTCGGTDSTHVGCPAGSCCPIGGLIASRDGGIDAGPLRGQNVPMRTSP